jgi:hypothetical protein
MLNVLFGVTWETRVYKERNGSSCYAVLMSISSLLSARASHAVFLAYSYRYHPLQESSSLFSVSALSPTHTPPPLPQEVSSLSLRCSPLSYCLDIESCHGLIYSGCHHHGHPRRQSLLLRRLHLHHRMQTARNGARHAAAAAAEHLLPVHTSARD